MPGLNLICDAGGTLNGADRAVAAARGLPEHRAHPIVDTTHVFLNWHGYERYPVESWSEGAAVVALEGFLYGGVAWDPEAFLRAASLDDVAGRFRGVVHEADGDFVAVWIRTAPVLAICIAVDILGRLPLYWHFTGTSLIVSRSLAFIAESAGHPAPDRTAVAQTLLLHHPLNGRTLHEGIRRLPPGGILTWDGIPGNAPRLDQCHWLPSAELAAGQSIDRCAGRLTDAFREGLGRRLQRIPVDRRILSLSGGLDSRAVASALPRLDPHAVARTFTFDDPASAIETRLAARVAEHCKLDWASVPVRHPTLAEASQLLALKNGLNNAANAYANRYLRALGGVTDRPPLLISGVGGDVVAVGRHPCRRLGSIDELSDLILRRSALLGPLDAAALTGVSLDALLQELSTYLKSLPGDDLVSRHERFYFAHFEHGEYFEGEDRNRAYMWTIAPFYARPFCELAFGVPMKWRRRRQLQTAFLRALDPALCRIPNAANGLRPGSVRDRWRQRLRELSLTYGGLEALRGRMRSDRTTARADLFEWVAARAGQPGPSSEVVDRAVLSRIVAAGLSEKQLWTLYTVLGYFELPSVVEAGRASTRP